MWKPQKPIDDLTAAIDQAQLVAQVSQRDSRGLIVRSDVHRTLGFGRRGPHVALFLVQVRAEQRNQIEEFGAGGDALDFPQFLAGAAAIAEQLEHTSET